PFGLEFAGRPWTDGDLLAIAAAWEKAGDWRKPPTLVEAGVLAAKKARAGRRTVEGAGTEHHHVPHKNVAWDHVSWPGNDFLGGSRATDDGVKAAASNSMSALAGVEGKYGPAERLFPAMSSPPERLGRSARGTSRFGDYRGVKDEAAPLSRHSSLRAPPASVASGAGHRFDPRGAGDR